MSIDPAVDFGNRRMLVSKAGGLGMSLIRMDLLTSSATTFARFAALHGAPGRIGKSGNAGHDRPDKAQMFGTGGGTPSIRGIASRPPAATTDGLHPRVGNGPHDDGCQP